MQICTTEYTVRTPKGCSRGVKIICQKIGLRRGTLTSDTRGEDIQTRFKSYLLQPNKHAVFLILQSVQDSLSTLVFMCVYLQGVKQRRGPGGGHGQDFFLDFFPLFFLFALTTISFAERMVWNDNKTVEGLGFRRIEWIVRWRLSESPSVVLLLATPHWRLAFTSSGLSCALHTLSCQRRRKKHQQHHCRR
jgi:hypothetical protein